MSWRPSQKALNRFDELVKQNNKLRKQLLRRRSQLEKSDEGRVYALPSLVVPEKAQPSAKINFRKIKREEFQAKMRALSQAVTGGLEGWYKRNYKRPILEAWRTAIEQVITEEYGDTGVLPISTVFGKKTIGKYTKETMEAYPDLKPYMEMYNRLYSMNIAQFMYMYDRGYLPPFKYIYNEMKGSFSANYLEEMKYNIDHYTPKLKDAREYLPRTRKLAKSRERAKARKK